MKKKKRAAPQLPYAVELQQRKLADMQAAAEKSAQIGSEFKGKGFQTTEKFIV